ncbi:hypothetical protein [Streptomyces sp. NPDC093109]|uniref:hypothetical protein n=1 Tax=Streptomyces sp. NPDC093109 TaxID=3154977 RepID=UPI00344C07E2
MSFLRKAASGAVTLVSVAALTAVAAPVSVAAESAVADASVSVTPLCSGSWKKAVGIPGKWTTITDSTCSVFGNPKYEAAYEWTAERGKPCIKVKGFVKGKAKWYDAGCGAKGKITKVPWGNVAASKAIKVKGASTFQWR